MDRSYLLREITEIIFKQPCEVFQESNRYNKQNDNNLRLSNSHLMQKTIINNMKIQSIFEICIEFDTSHQPLQGSNFYLLMEIMYSGRYIQLMQTSS